MQSILVVDDEKHTRQGLQMALSENYDVSSAANADEALRLMQTQNFDAIITDLRMSGKSGLNLIDEAIRMPNKPACIMMTAYGNIDVAVEAMKHGASDFLTKPIDIDRLETILARALEKRNAGNSSPISEKKSKINVSNSEIIAESGAMKKVLEQALRVASSRATVMLTGETGTGKELIAEFIHKNSPRKNAKFVPVHCAAIPSNLIESELFGYEKGAFTGASIRKEGRFETANGGTLFLDEIGEIDSPTQVKLLRFLETRKIERLGAVEETPLDIRLVCATNRDLKAMSATGDFREDLYYRLNVVEISLPPLRKRKEDIAPLVNFYIKKYAEENGAENVSVSPRTMEILSNYQWPGNIRELRNFCENAVVLRTSNIIDEKSLDARFYETENPIENDLPPLTFDKKENELALIKKAVEKCGGNKSKAAELLGISRRTLHRKLKS
ncbi:sigma-54-dependent transcriptional regulator [Intestinicryptomonas porci]|uniref:Sigma-54 dependent transcriptional regulator n=1 Tax=Intestinicryptomonas porci TaxID=2926320 RepID=A0ABU4WEL2_9BACT|nr:sigma-54 dependent transcriptional regulator [Opitutales bacterium CLA-KB-P66]